MLIPGVFGGILSVLQLLEVRHLLAGKKKVLSRVGLDLMLP